MADEDLMRFIQAKEMRAFDSLVKRYHRRFFQTVYRWVLSQEDAEDIVQVAFLKLWTGKAKFKEDKSAKFTTWFYRILYNQAMDHLRKHKQQFVDVNDVFLADSANQELDMAQRDQHQLVFTALQSLPERQRVALSLVYFEALPQKEIAGMMGVSVKALESLLSRGKAALREWFESRHMNAGVLEYV